jgi:hypothetical protein
LPWAAPRIRWISPTEREFNFSVHRWNFLTVLCRKEIKSIFFLSPPYTWMLTKRIAFIGSAKHSPPRVCRSRHCTFHLAAYCRRRGAAVLSACVGWTRCSQLPVRMFKKRVCFAIMSLTAAHFQVRAYLHTYLVLWKKKWTLNNSLCYQKRDIQHFITLCAIHLR